MASHSDVGQAWREGRRAKGFNMHTDGRNIYSYAMKIGTTLEDGTKVLLDCRGWLCRVSPETTKHIRHAHGLSDAVKFVVPDAPDPHRHVYFRYHFPDDIRAGITEWQQRWEAWQAEQEAKQRKREERRAAKAAAKAAQPALL